MQAQDVHTQTGQEIANDAQIDSQRACMALLGRMDLDDQQDPTIKALMSVGAWDGLLGYLSVMVTQKAAQDAPMSAKERSALIAFESVDFDVIGYAIDTMGMTHEESFVRSVLALESSDQAVDSKLVQLAVRNGMPRDAAKQLVSAARRKQAIYTLRTRTADALDAYMGKRAHALLVKAAHKRARIESLKARLDALWERSADEISAMQEIKGLADRIGMSPLAMVNSITVDDHDRVQPESLTNVSAWYGKKGVIASVNKDGVTILFDSYSAFLTWVAQSNDLHLPHGTFRLGGHTVRIDSAGIAVDGGRYSHKALAGQFEILTDNKRTSKIAVAAMSNTACFLVPSNATTDSALSDLVAALRVTTFAAYDRNGGVCGEQSLRDAIMREVA